MATPKRVSAEDVHGKLPSGKALLVCAYENDAKFRQMPLEGAISFSEFEKRKASLPRDTEVVFY
jgi:hypothetical protein